MAKMYNKPSLLPRAQKVRTYCTFGMGGGAFMWHEFYKKKKKKSYIIPCWFQQPSWKPVLHKGKNSLYLALTEYIRAIQVQNQCFLVQDQISCKMDPQCTRNCIVSCQGKVFRLAPKTGRGSYILDVVCDNAGIGTIMLICMFHVIVQAGSFKDWYGFFFKLVLRFTVHLMHIY